MTKMKKIAIKNLRPFKGWEINALAISLPLIVGLLWAGFNMPVDNVVDVECSKQKIRMSIILGQQSKFDSLKNNLSQQQNDKGMKKAKWTRDHPGVIADSFCIPGPSYSLYVL